MLFFAPHTWGAEWKRAEGVQSHRHVSGGDTIQGQAFGGDGFYISRGSLASLSGIFNDEMIEQGL